MRTAIAAAAFLVGGISGGTGAAAFTPTTLLATQIVSRSSATTSLSSLSNNYNSDYYRDYSNSANYNYNNNNNYSDSYYRNRGDNYVLDRNRSNSGRFDNSVGGGGYGYNDGYYPNYGYGRRSSSRSSNTGGYGNSREYRSYDNYNSNEYYRGGGSVTSDYSRPYDRIGSSENFRSTRRGGNGGYGRINSRMMGGYDYGDTIGDFYSSNDNDYYYNNNNYVLQGRQRRGGYADDIGGRSRYSTPLYSNGGYYNSQGLSEDFRTGREGPMSSMTSRQRRLRNINNSNRIQDYYTPGERELLSQRQNNNLLRYGWQQQYDWDRGNVRRGSGEDFRRGSAVSRISDYFTPLERERRQMWDNRVLGRGSGSGSSSSSWDRGDTPMTSSLGYSGGVENRRGGYYEDYPNYGFDNYYDDDDDYFEDDGGYSSGSRMRGNRRSRGGGSAWDNLLNMFR